MRYKTHELRSLRSGCNNFDGKFEKLPVAIAIGSVKIEA